MLSFALGVVVTLVTLALLGRASGQTGPNSRVPVKETVVAVKNPD